MHTSTIASMPWVQDYDNRQRSSFASRISGLFGRRNESAIEDQSPRATTTFEVPLFLSPARYDPRSDRNVVDEGNSHVRHHSLEVDNMTEWSQPSELPAASIYSRTSSARPLTGGVAALEPSENGNFTSTQSRQSRNTQRRRKTKKRQIRHRRKRKTSLTRQLRTAKHLSLAFGITFLLAAITYLVLAATGISSGLVFHVIFVLLLLALFGISLHGCCRWIILSRRRREKRRHKARQRQWFGHVDVDIERADQDQLDGEVAPEEPIQIIMKEDEVTDGVVHGSTCRLQQPPPTYGNVRESKRMDPTLVHWKHVPPSPLTPTYAEAMNDVQRVVGYRPPSYAESDGDATRIIERQRVDVDGSLEHIHPLHRNV